MKKGLSLNLMAAVLATVFSAFCFSAESKVLIKNVHFQSLVDKDAGADSVRGKSQDFKKAKGVVKISSGIESLYTVEEKLLYKKVKAECGKILGNKTPHGFYEIEPIAVKGAQLRVDQIKKVLYALQNDCPEIFWISSSFSYGYKSSGVNILRLSSIFSAEEKEKYSAALRSKVEQIISMLPKNATDYQKELFFHDYIIDNCEYKMSQGDYKIFTPYGCLVEGVAVCEGYSKAMQMLLNEVGVDCRTIVGSRGAEPHMWNLVRLGDDWYHLDVTWDGGGEWQRYNYFNVTDKVISFDHVINEKLKPQVAWSENKRYNFNLPVCNSTKENYFEKNAFNASKLGRSDEVVEYIANRVKNKEDCFYIKADEGTDFEEVKRQVFSVTLFDDLAFVNSVLTSKSQLSTISIPFSICAAQKVIIFKLNYV